MAGALATYARTKNYPHFTVDEFTIEQHSPLSVGTTALEHPAGTVDTNRAGAIQIEIVGYTAQAADMSDALCSRIGMLMAWIAGQTGIGWHYPATDQRMPSGVWAGYNGWCGHVHVPNNSHTDPGAIPLAKMFPFLGTPGAVFSPVQSFGDDVQRTQVTSPPLDETGNGYIDTGIPFEKFVNVLPFGPSPDRDTYAWPNWYWAVNNTNGKARIEIEGAGPRSTVSFAIWAVS